MTYFLRRLCTIVLVLMTLLSTILTAASRPIVGLASWYGKQHHGRKMANGRVFDRFLLTAAHRTYAFGTLLRVCLIKTGKCVEVEVTDRGPVPLTRIIDLSEAAADAIGLRPYGISRVTLEKIN
jgi:rare lipoprotein A